MKILPGTRLLITMGIGLASGAAILVFARTPTPTPTSKDFQFHLVIKCSEQKIDSFNKALNYWKGRNQPPRDDDYKILYDSGHPEEGNYPEDSATPCPDKPTSNVTQHLATNNAEDLRKFLKKLNQ